MRILVVGSRGQLGTDLMGLLADRRPDIALGLDMPDIDIAAPESVAQAFDEFAPDVVINCAAWTAVDAAEENEAGALRVNGDGPRVLAEQCAKSGAWLVQLSTDYVFDGHAKAPYAEDAKPDPKSAYGRTKLAGEVAVQQGLPEHHYLVRTAWLYGCHGTNFARTMLKLEAERDSVSVVTDQIGQPTYSRDLAAQILMLLDARPKAGIFHATNSGQTSWYDFTREIFSLANADPSRVKPTTSAEFVRPAPRPPYSVLGHDSWVRVGLPAMRHWKEGLAAAFADGITAD